MATIDQIQEFASQIAERFNPQKIILFGSYAHGQPTPDSDVDLLVIMEHEGLNPSKAAEIRMAIRRQFPLDLLVRKPFEVQQRLKAQDRFFTEVIQKGTPLYERRNS